MTGHRIRTWRPALIGGLLILLTFNLPFRLQSADRVDFNRDIRRILSENCFKCHGPDPNERKGGKHGLRLDTPEGAQTDLGGYSAIVPRHPEKSEVIRRITTKDADDHMPPPKSGKHLTARDIDLLRQWIAAGASYARHWAYTKPMRSALPAVRQTTWPRNAIDYFVLARLEKEGRQPSGEADRYALVRRAALDLTGLPPAPAEVDRFIEDRQPGAFERLVDRLLGEQAFGEHWARLWLDQARYADSAGYADDPPRTIWAYRDYVIRSFNANKPYDRFTLEQLAGDLLDDPSDEELVATAFHRNTLTNNEGGTNDEEFRNVAIVDRVNTTMAVWMGTTIACAQCHNHKYDPITQEDYFRFFAILNNTEDADRTDETPVLPLYTKSQKRERQELAQEIQRLEKTLKTPTTPLAEAQADWEKRFSNDLDWHILKPEQMTSQAGAAISLQPDGALQVEKRGKTDTYTFAVSIPEKQRLLALRLEALPDQNLPSKGSGHADGQFILSRLRLTLTPPDEQEVTGRYLRIEIPGKEKILSLAEVQVFSGSNNVALKGEAKQSSTAYDGPAKLAIDGNTDGKFEQAKSTTHSAISDDPWWELDLKSSPAVERVVLWNRTDANTPSRLSHFRIVLLNEKREPVWQREVEKAPDPSAEYYVSGPRPIRFAQAKADFTQKDFAAASLIANPDPKTNGWAVGPEFTKPHAVTLFATEPAELPARSRLTVTLDQLSSVEYATLARLRLAVTGDPRTPEQAPIPGAILAILSRPDSARNASEREQVFNYYVTIAPALQTERSQLADRKKRLDQITALTTVPVMRELAGDKRRKTRVQRRGNFLDLGQEVGPGTPADFPHLPGGAAADRIALARWLVAEENPLTARVLVNRFWEAIFGIGIIRTSEEFGTQGEPPSHQELLDWLAVELMATHWDVKQLLRLMVTSATYRQSSRVTPELQAADPDNRLLARGPRFRLSAETIRDQALFVSGLLSPKLYGPPVKPAQPSLGLSAAFGSKVDWETSAGEDRYRRAIYTTWRRSNPYPSMATFDAPNREVCAVRRERSNTPLQALVTLNDPVYVEAAQALARRMVSAGGNAPADKARYGFRLCLARPPTAEELKNLVQLYENTRQRLVSEPAKAQAMATKPIGAAPPGAEVVSLAAWTVVGNVLLNLDETLMRR